MKRKSILLSIAIMIAACFTAVTASAQPMLKGNPSFENFIGSPGMWALIIGSIFLVVMFVIAKKKKILKPDAVEINK